MDPVAFAFGPVKVHWYGIILACGLLAGFFVALHRSKRYGISQDDLVGFLVYAVPLAIIGARAYYVLFNLDYYFHKPFEIFAVWNGGLAIHGAVIAGMLTGFFYVRNKKIAFFDMADLCAPSLVLGQSIGRWGNYVNQEAYGRITDLPWAMEIAGARRHPTFLYESIWDILSFILLLFLGKNKSIRKGDIFALYLILYSVGRFFIESFRTDSLMVDGFRTAQIASIVMIICGGLIFWYNRRKEKDKSESI